MQSGYPFGNNYAFIPKPTITIPAPYLEAAQIAMDTYESNSNGSNINLAGTEASYGVGGVVASTPSHTAT